MEEEIKIVQEAEVISEKIIEKPILTDPEAKIENVGTVTNNIKEVKEQAEKIREYYKTVIVTSDTLNVAKTEQADINKAKKKVADFRKDIVKKFKEPINEFEQLAKETEKILEETYETISNQCKAFDERKKESIRNELKIYFDEYKASKNLGFTQYVDMNQSVGLADVSEKGTIAKKKYKEIDEYIDAIVKDVDTIGTMQNADEILVEYMNNRDLALSIKTVQDRYKSLNEIKEIKQVKPIETIEETKVEVNVLSAPVVQDKQPKKLKRARFEIIYEDDQVAIDLVKFLKERGINYAIIKQ